MPLPSWQWGDTLVGVATLVVLLLWPRLRLPVPGHLPAVLVGVGLGFGLHQFGVDVATIGSKFSYTLADGTQGMGIPIAPTLVMPWACRDRTGRRWSGTWPPSSGCCPPPSPWPCWVPSNPCSAPWCWMA